jgi:hypothetical protein
VLAVERADLGLAYELYREMAVVDPRRRERGEGGPAELLGRVDELDLDQRD